MEAVARELYGYRRAWSAGWQKQLWVERRSEAVAEVGFLQAFLTVILHLQPRGGRGQIPGLAIGSAFMRLWSLGAGARSRRRSTSGGWAMNEGAQFQAS